MNLSMLNPLNISVVSASFGKVKFGVEKTALLSPILPLTKSKYASI